MVPFDSRPLRTPPPAATVRAAMWLHRQLLRLLRKVTPPELQVADMATGLAWSHVLAAVVRAGVPDALGDDALAADELARRVEVDADLLHRTLRALSARGLFQLDSQGRFRNSPASNVLRRAHPSGSRDFSLYFASASNRHTWADFHWTLATGGSAFEHVHKMTIWEWFERHPDERETFARAMTGITLVDAPVISRLYPFREVQTVCDVGGGRGLMLSEILVCHPALRGILCDAPAILESADALLTARGVRGRVTLAPGNFFEQVPPGADAYLLKNVLHDWGDAPCVQLLRVVRAAAAPGARVLIAETLVGHTSRDLIGTAADLQMAVACSRGRERDARQIHDLLHRAGFSTGRVFHSPLISVIEGQTPGG
jgi:hypothetical protein